MKRERGQKTAKERETRASLRRRVTGVSGEERRGEEKRKREGGGERGGREKEIARREARTWQATERREREEGGETSARRRRAHLLESDGQVKKEKRRGKEEKGGAHLTSTTPRPVPAAPNAHCSSGGLRHRAMQHSSILLLHPLLLQNLRNGKSSRFREHWTLPLDYYY
jgi:hypothetical protein